MRITTNPLTRLTGGALLVAAVGILLQYFADAGDFPLLPPGPIILAITAAIVLFAPWKWAPLVGSLMGVQQIVGFFLNQSVDRFSDLTPLVAFVGLWIQTVAILVAIVAGVMATMQNDRNAGSARERHHEGVRT